MAASKFFTDEQKTLIVNAIQNAEKNTSGEIRVHVDKLCNEDVLDRTAWVFKTLKMHETAARNGVLIYVALKSHKLAIIGDSGINAIVPDHFWEDARNIMIEHFKRANYTEGIVRTIAKVGEQLKEHFPYQTDDINELSDDISFGKQ